MRSYFLLMLYFSILTVGCENGPPAIGADPNGDSLQIVNAFPQLDFTRPVDIQHNGGEDLFVVEQRGVIHVFPNHPETSSTKVFLDIQDRVDDRDNEEGLLGMAFHPQYSFTGYFFVNYTTSQSTTRISRFTVDDNDPMSALASSEQIVLEFSQPFGNHNGGQLAFGPDGYLYIAVGDGGSGGDPRGHGQNTATVLGSILRLDVDHTSPNLNYTVPPDNPFFANQEGAREEIFAFGLRNPWRMSFDSETGALWTGDVGQNNFEEIDIIERGGNYGWNIMEGFDCFQGSGCDRSNLKSPQFHYSHENGDISVTGGYVYRGSISSLFGWYIYADYASGRIWALQTQSANPENILLFDTNLRVTSFGVDHLRELYLCSLDGKIFKITP